MTTLLLQRCGAECLPTPSGIEQHDAADPPTLQPQKGHNQQVIKPTTPSDITSTSTGLMNPRTKRDADKLALSYHRGNQRLFESLKRCVYKTRCTHKQCRSQRYNVDCQHQKNWTRNHRTLEFVRSRRFWTRTWDTDNHQPCCQLRRMLISSESSAPFQQHPSAADNRHQGIASQDPIQPTPDPSP